MLIARTDALATDGYEAAISRLEAARRNGADIGFLEGITKDSEASAVILPLCTMANSSKLYHWW